MSYRKKRLPGAAVRDLSLVSRLLFLIVHLLDTLYLMKFRLAFDFQFNLIEYRVQN